MESGEMDLLSKKAILSLPRDKEFNLEGKLLAEYINVKDIEALPTVQSQSTAGQLNDSAQSTNLIDRGQAIDAINHICPVDTEYDCTLLDRVDVRCVLSDLPSVRPVATDTNVGDTISRQAAIDALDFEIVHMTAYCDGKNEGNPLAQYNKGLEDGKKAIEALPSAQPEPPWIPCEERMPEEHEWLGTKKFGTTISDKVYVTFENPKGERFCQHLSFQNGKLSAFDKSKIDAFYKGSKPIAWMPLPEPYAERRTE